MTGPSPRAPRPAVVLDEPHPAAGPDVAGLGLEATAAESYWTRRPVGTWTARVRGGAGAARLQPDLWPEPSSPEKLGVRFVWETLTTFESSLTN